MVSGEEKSFCFSSRISSIHSVGLWRVSCSNLEVNAFVHFGRGINPKTFQTGNFLPEVKAWLRGSFIHWRLSLESQNRQKSKWICTSPEDFSRKVMATIYFHCKRTKRSKQEWKKEIKGDK